jgi:RNA polymerase sigma factor (sigma-70 family)
VNRNGKQSAVPLDGVIADQRLVDECLAGDEAAWERVYGQCHPALLVSIKALLGSQAANDDLVQEIAARVWYSLLDGDGRRLQRYDADRRCRLRTFLAALARREIQQYRRSEQRRQSREAVVAKPPLADPGPTIWELNASLREFLATLTPRESEFYEAYLLSFPAGTSLRELSPANLWQLRHRVRQKLRRFLEVEQVR